MLLRMQRRIEAVGILLGKAPRVDPDNFQFALPRLYYNPQRLREQHGQLFNPALIISEAEALTGTGGRGELPLASLLRAAQAGFLTQRPEFARMVCEASSAWWQAHPPFHGRSWRNSMETGVRLIHWIWAFSMVRDLLHHDQQTLAQEFIYRHAQSLSAALRGPGNSLDVIVAASALAVAGTHFSLFDRAEEWQKQGWKMLTDRVHRAIPLLQRKMQSAPLACLVEHVVMAYSVAKMKRLALPVALLKDLESAVIWLAHGEQQLTAGTGDALPHAALSQKYERIRQLCNCLAIIRGNAELKRLGQGLDEWTFWVFGDSAVENYGRIN